MDAPTVRLLKLLWNTHVRKFLDEDLARCHKQLVNAESVDTIRLVQGRAKALISLRNLPEHLEAALTEDDQKTPPISEGTTVYHADQ